MKKAIFLFAALLLSSSLLAAQSGGISANIRYYDKKIYYTNDDPIFVLLTVENNSPRVFRFRIADDRAFSVDFETRTMSNRPVENADILERKRSTAAHVFFRDVSIEAGESFSFVENLRNYSKISTPGAYIVQAKLYPELINSVHRQNAAVNTAPAAAENVPLVTNRLNLQIKPLVIIGVDGLPVAMDVETGAVLARDKLSPDRVISWTLEARQKSAWEKFFLYLNLEKMIMRDGARQRKWRAESEEGRLRMVAEYREALKRSSLDGDVSAIPMNFEIERTEYNGREGKVIVLEKFKTGDYIERKRYTYYMEKEDEYWMIADYTVTNLGTE